MESKNPIEQIFRDDLEIYLECDPEGEYVQSSFEQHVKNGSMFLLSTSEFEKQNKLSDLEESLLVWLDNCEPVTRRDFTGWRNTQLKMELGQEISVTIWEGVYSFVKYEENTDDFKSDKYTTFAMIYPGHPRYSSFTGILVDMATTCFRPKEKVIKF